MFEATLYVGIFHHTMLALVLLTAAVYGQGQSGTSSAIGYNKTMLWAVAGTMILFLGTRPVSGAFIDMPAYANVYSAIAQGNEKGFSDPGFNLLMSGCGRFLDVNGFFLVCDFLYIAPIAIAMRRVHREWAFAAFLAIAGSTSFFAYGVNGIRNGLATSLLLAAFAFADRNKLAGALLAAMAASMHKSVLLPIAAFLATYLVARPGLYAAAWTGALALSATMGEGLAGFIGNLGIFGEDERLANYTTALVGAGGDKGGFRIDFILYSIVPVMISYAMAGAHTKKDPLYRRLLCAYLLSNAFWLLVIHAGQSNRFAYLSWFMLPWVIIYPYMPAREEPGHVRQVGPANTALLGAAIFAHFLFTYVLIIVVYGSRFS